MRVVLVFVLISLATAGSLRAQRWAPTGITPLSAAHTNGGVSGAAVPPWSPPATHREARRWIVVGAAIGAVVGGSYAVAEVARGHHDALATAFSPIFIALGVGAGAIGGGVVGGVAYAVSHPASLTMSPNDR